jgi:cytochrome c
MRRAPVRDLMQIKAMPRQRASLKAVFLPPENFMKPLALILTTVLLSPTAWAADSANDKAMLQLANSSGCMTCHHIEPGAKGPNGMAPIGPAWQDVATQYKGQDGALKQLTATVLAGSSPYASHWKDKVSGLAMPPNKVAISQADTEKLVGWILTLNEKR